MPAFPTSLMMDKPSLKDFLTSKEWVSDYKLSHVDIELKKDEIFSSSDSSAGSLGSKTKAGDAVPALKDAEDVSATPKKQGGTDWMAEYNSMFGGAGNVKTVPLKPPAATTAAMGSISNTKSTSGSFTPSVDLTNMSVDLSSFMSQSTDLQLKPDGYTEKLTSDAAQKIGELMEQNLKDAAAKKQQKKKKKAKRNRDPDVKEYVEPTDLDCLLGRGGRSNHHPGNKKYRTEVLNLQSWYKSSTKNKKTDLSQLLVDYVHQYGGRFLKQEKDTGKWYIVTNIVARRKCSQALREHIPMEERLARRAAQKKAEKKEDEETTE